MKENIQSEYQVVILTEKANFYYRILTLSMTSLRSDTKL